MLPLMLDIATLTDAYQRGDLTPLYVIEEVIARRAAARDPAIFISTVSDADLRTAATALMAAHPVPGSLPLWGIPFAAKDNIDAVGLPTTAACPDFAYDPVTDSTVVARLRAAGAMLVGKTNLDQFATGLNGSRSPYGAPRCVFDADYVSGGSSSGSAVAVASGLVSFALGTDTAGSGRVPAMFNNLVGIKPTPGLVPNVGVVPACRSVDCVTVLSACVADGIAVRRVMEGFDAADPYSLHARPVGLPGTLRIGVLAGAEREFFGNTQVERLYDAAIAQAGTLGSQIVPIDYAPFREAASLLYDGPWVAERLAAVEVFFAAHADKMDQTVRKIIAGAKDMTAVDAFNGQYHLLDLKRKTDAEWAKVDILLLPTSPTTHTVAAMLADPIRLNGQFGRYTNFVNLLGCAAIAVPCGFDAAGHLPAGVTLIGPAFSDDALAPFADALHRALGQGMGADRKAALPAARPVAPQTGIEIVVVGAHLTGMPLNGQLTGLGGHLKRACRTARDYRLYVLPGTVPVKPGLIHDPDFDGPGIRVEVWSLPPAGFGQFVSAIPAPLGVGKITLDDGSQVSGFLCEAHAVSGAPEITALGGWKAHVAQQAKR
jgi:allophanate hydrolase